MKAMWGIPSAYCGLGSPVTPFSPTQLRPPISADPSAKAREYPITAHSMAMIPRATKLILIVLMTCFSRTRPP